MTTALHPARAGLACPDPGPAFIHWDDLPPLDPLAFGCAWDSPDVAQEVRDAEHSRWVLDALGRVCCSRPIMLRELEDLQADAREAVYEAERDRVGVPGLVSIPTSGFGTAAAKARDRSERDAEVRKSEARRQGPAPEARRKARVARLRRQVGFAARGHLAQHRPGFRDDYVAMVTLTYRKLDEWNPRHLSDALRQARAWLKERGQSLRYVWVAELQKRGALHYHVAVWLPSGVMLPKFDVQGWWPHGSTNVEQAKAAVPYLMKYLSKGMDTLGFPKGARIHGAGGLEEGIRRAKAWLGFPAFVKARADCMDAWKRAPGGGWSSPDGTVWGSEYLRAWLGDRWGCIKVTDHGRPFDPSGPFSWLRGKSC